MHLPLILPSKPEVLLPWLPKAHSSARTQAYPRLPQNWPLALRLTLTICDACILVPWLETLYWSFRLYPTLLCAGRVTYLDPLPFGFRLGLDNGMNQQKMQEWERVS